MTLDQLKQKASKQDKITIDSSLLLDLLKDRDALIKELRRFDWYFTSEKDNTFLNTYLTGYREKWEADRWRIEIDKAMAQQNDGAVQS